MIQKIQKFHLWQFTLNLHLRVFLPAAVSRGELLPGFKDKEAGQEVKLICQYSVSPMLSHSKGQKAIVLKLETEIDGCLKL